MSQNDNVVKQGRQFFLGIGERRVEGQESRVENPEKKAVFCKEG
jgi:hypothetical protein